VFILDTGIYPDHAEFLDGTRKRVLGQMSYVNGNGAGDGNGHGTHCAGTAAGNTYGMAKDARLVAVQVLDSRGSGSYSGVIAGIDFVRTSCLGGFTNIGGQSVDTRCVASLSLGGGYSSTMNAAVAALVASGIPVAVAAGNDARDASSYSPASEASAITVGASRSDDTMASFSNYGPLVDIFAPGEGIKSATTSCDTCSASWSGTSMATPHVAGALAVILTMAPSLTPPEALKALLGLGIPNKIVDLDSSAGTCKYSLLQVPPAITHDRILDCGNDDQVILDTNALPNHASPNFCDGSSSDPAQPPSDEPETAEPAPTDPPKPTCEAWSENKCSARDNLAETCDERCCNAFGWGWYGVNKRGKTCYCSECTSP